MADTTRWTLQRCADAAGKRVVPYPTCEEAAAPEAHCCQGCGQPLDGQKSPNTHLRRVYCSKQCMKMIQRRWHQGPDEAATLRMQNYSWGDW